MAGRPDGLVLDDPVMGLDPVVRRQFLDATIELLAGRGAAVLYSTHVLADAERIADRVGILHGGGLIVDAAPDELRRRVQRRFLRAGEANSALPPDLPGLLRARRRREGYELLLLDWSREREARLGARAAALSEPSVPTLEELFFDLTARDEELALFAGEASR
jgi:ABC-2 type transport system ATP-binding protein